MLLYTAEGNWSVDHTKLHMSFFVTIKFSLSISLGYLWCVCSEFSGSVDKLSH